MILLIDNNIITPLWSFVFLAVGLVAGGIALGAGYEKGKKEHD